MGALSLVRADSRVHRPHRHIPRMQRQRDHTLYQRTIDIEQKITIIFFFSFFVNFSLRRGGHRSRAFPPEVHRVLLSTDKLLSGSAFIPKVSTSTSIYPITTRDSMT